jgi:hypothetical protein
VIIFESVWFLSKKKVTKQNLKKTETGSNRPVRFGLFWFLGQKQVQTGLARFWLGLTRFFRFGSVWIGFFPVWLGFFSLGSVRFF